MKLFQHQAAVLAASALAPELAVFWEQGTGKTLLMLETARAQQAANLIDAVLVVAPNGVHRNWTEDEIPKHASDTNWATHTYYSNRASTKRHVTALEALLADEFPVLAISYDAFITPRGVAYVRRFLKKRRVLFILDESTAIKSPNTVRSKKIVAAGAHAKYKRILTGTPVTNSPFDVYAPFRFLDHAFWKANGFANFGVFKAYFGIWQRGVNAQQGREYDYVVGYRNLEQLRAMIDHITTRVVKVDVLDLPPKLYVKRYFELSAEQCQVYQSLRDNALALLHTGDVVAIPQAIVMLLRLAQVTSNYLPTESGELIPLSPVNPRLACLMDIVAETTHPAIIWARFRRDIDLICHALRGRCVRYDGATTDDERHAAKRAFQNGEAQFFVANPAAGGMGLTLTAAQTVIYYNNTFNLQDRLQSEDRAHRIGQAHPVLYIDIVAPNTVDVHIVKALQNKVNLASRITGDTLKEWL